MKFSVKDDLPFSSAFCMGKIHPLPSHTFKIVYQSPLELMYGDLCDPSPMVSNIICLLLCSYSFYLVIFA